MGACSGVGKKMLPKINEMWTRLGGEGGCEVEEE